MKSKETKFGIADFWKNGFAGPFSIDLSETEIEPSISSITEMLKTKASHPFYERFSVRDWHLIYPSLRKLFTDEGIVSSLQSLLGEDLILWRTKIFNKEPLEGDIGWHQEWGAFNGEEIGNDVPALEYKGKEECWDLTVWIALCDMSLDMSPIRFARGTNSKRFPIEMAPLMQSEFFTDPFNEVSTVDELIKRARANSLILDIDTSQAFSQEDSSKDIKMEEAKERVLDYIKNAKGAVTLGFNTSEHEIVSLEVKKGDYWIFTERVMHGSGMNKSDKSRLAINGRITRGDTLVYPGRLKEKYIDGSNINISQHKCVLLSGKNKQPMNKILACTKKCTQVCETHK